HYGVREFGMVAIANGIALHRGHIPFTGTFLVFSDYARNAIRMAALMRQRQILVLTHDSIGLGEDGPTHQPIEHAASLRLIPNLDVWRPADSVETAVAWRLALERTDGPSALLLSRQNLPFIERSPQQIEAIGRGGYVLREAERAPDLILIATGSEIALALDAQGALAASGIAATVVSLPCTRRFDAQPPEYRAALLPPDVPKLAIEAGSGDGWWRYVGGHGDVLGIDRFGASAPAPRLFEFFGFTVDHVVARAKLLLSR
ncbi:MAG: transketolase C-terminal domain-containing protein, partial [Tepidiphilus sp.]|nr:transketolase C-terminal domain-containing protein [Tepidiphilus sp.]